jgi:hypothetical protein
MDPTPNFKHEPKPSAEMVAFYTERTAEHITRVKNNMIAMDGWMGFDLETLTARGSAHDASKYSEEEFEGYVHHTWWHKCRNEGKPFDHTQEIGELVKKSIYHHVHLNRHHHEHHKNVNEMTDLDLLEMVCDMTAMAQELNTSSDKSCKVWAEANVPLWGFEPGKLGVICMAIQEIDKRLDNVINK